MNLNTYNSIRCKYMWQIPYHYVTVPVQYGGRFVHVSKIGIHEKLSKPFILGRMVPIGSRASILDTISKTSDIPFCLICNTNKQIKHYYKNICIHHLRGFEMASATTRATRRNSSPVTGAPAGRSEEHEDFRNCCQSACILALKNIQSNIKCKGNDTIT